MTDKTLKTTPEFKRGDFVRIKEGTHQEGMPATRMGHIESYANGSRHYHAKGVTVQQTDQYYVYMTNGATLKFHEMFLELVDDEEQNRESR